MYIMILNMEKYDKAIFDISKENLPIHINSNDPTTRAIVQWRLYHNF